MKIRKKTYAVVLTAALILTLLPAFAYAEGETTGKPVDAVVVGAPQGVPGSSEVEGIYVEGTSVDVYYSETSDTPDKVYEYGEYTYKDENGVEQEIRGFLERGAEPTSFENYACVNVDYDNFESLKEGANDVPLIISVPTGVNEEGYINYVDFNKTLRVWARIDTPIKVEFVPADGFKLEGTVGYNYIDETDFYGEGNKFVVTIETRDDPEYVTPDIGSIEAEYLFYKSEDGSVEGFYDNGNPEFERFDMMDGIECYLKKGLNKDIELTYYAYTEGKDEPFELNFKVDIDAEKYGLYAEGKNSVYTGKVIKPDFVIFNTADEEVSAEEYTFKSPKNKKIGSYDIDVTIKDEFRDKYDTDEITVSYCIVPKAPVITSITAGKKSLTVGWKKLSKTALNNITGAYIELSTEEDFSGEVKTVKLSKKSQKRRSKSLLWRST